MAPAGSDDLLAPGGRAHPSTGAATAAAELVTRLRVAGCVFAEQEAAVLMDAAADAAQLQRWCERRVSGEPLEHVVGAVDFAGHRFALGPGTFVPRRRSEFLVELVLAVTSAAATADRPPGAPVTVVEMCCGIGAVGLSAARGLHEAGHRVQLHLAEIDEVALGWAERNATQAGLPDVRFHRGDLWSALPVELRGAVDVVVANAPYVPTARIPLMPPEARLYEPHLALDGGPEGVDLHRRLAGSAADWLQPGGTLIVETSTAQADLTASLMAAAGLVAVIDRDPDRWATAVTGRRTTPTGGAPG